MRTALIGEGALALRCLHALCQRGLTPSLVCSPDGSLADAAARLAIHHVSQRGEWAGALAVQSLDYVFSVRNPWILSPQELARVAGMAVNFHDSLLPRYAGMHATTWALCHGEVEHGITWHEVTSAIDAGRVLVQQRLAVSPQDTAFTLNTRCFDAAAQSFDHLLDALGQGGWHPQPQLGARSYFGARHRPPAQAVIDPAGTAASVLNLVRALDFGLGANPLAWPKLWLGERCLLVNKARALPGPGKAAPGVLVDMGPAGWRVGTASGDVELSGFCELDGRAVAPALLSALGRPYMGVALPGLPQALRAQLTALHERVCLRESHWAACLAQGVQAVSAPGVPLLAGAPQPQHLQRVPLKQTQRALAQVPVSDQLRWLQAAWALYLARVTRDAVFDIGLVRPQALTQGLGLFAPVVPWRVSHDPSLSFDTWVRLVAQGVERLVGMDTFALDLLARTPGLRGQSVLPDRWPVAMLIGPDIGPALARHAALVLCVPDDACALHWLASADEVPCGALDAMDASLAALVHASAHAPGQPIGRLPLMPAAERERMLVSWNATRVPIPSRCMHTLFHEQVQRTPEAPAARCGAAVLSYAELDARANHLAQRLISRGVRPGELVALSVRRSLDVLTGMLGILKAGAAYVPVEVGAPRSRIESMLAQSGARVVVTHEAARQPLAFLGEALLVISGGPPPADTATPLLAGEHPDELAYCVFTSGSTGQPKGVEIRHRSLVNHALAVRSMYGLGVGERVLLSASIGFDVAAEQIYPALISGAEIVVRPDDLFESLARFDEFVRASQLSVLTLPTALWHEWVRFLSSRSRAVPLSLKVVGVGTEKVLSEYLAQWRALGGERLRFIQGYGPTEATITSTMYVHEGEVDARRALPIGRPLANTEIYVLDPQGEPVPVGIEGEIHIAGMGLARGYLGRPDLTAQSFIAHPFDPDPQARLYKTGDLGRFEADGQLVYVGRADFQVKVRGYRVELGEVEGALRQCGGVRDALVMLREDLPGPPRLVAYVLAPEGAAPDALALAAHCRACLPDHMVPHTFMVLGQWPVTANGKVDRRALPAPEAGALPDAGPVCYHDDIELIVAQAFSQALPGRVVPKDQSFFELGGDSLAAMGLITQLESALSVQLSLSELFAAPTVEALSAHIRAGSKGNEPLIMQLRPGRGVPIWLFAGVLRYEALARAMSGPNPIYVLSLPVEEAMVRSGAALPSLAVLAESYMAAMRRHAPHGPYIIGGFSIGGAIAYEVSRRLAEQGERIDLLVMIDTCLPGALGPGTLGSGPLAWLTRQAHALTKGGWRVLLARGMRLIEAARQSGPPDPGERERRRMHAHMMAEFARVLGEFEQGLQPYHGAVVLYRSRGEDAYRSVAPGHGFAHMVRGPWSQIDIDGDHMGMMAPGHVEAMAADLSARLNLSSSTVLPQAAPIHNAFHHEALT